VYEPTSGRCEKLPVNFSKYIKELCDVYDLYEVKMVSVPYSEEQDGQECSVEHCDDDRVSTSAAVVLDGSKSVCEDGCDDL